MITPEDTGTPAVQPEVAPAGGTPETPVADGGGGEPREEAAELAALRAQKDQWLREKSNTEQIRRENEELRQRMGQPPPTQQMDPMREKFERGRSQLEAAAAQEGGEWAVNVLSLMDALPAMQQRVQREVQLSRFDETERVQIEAIQRDQYERRGDRLSVETAREILNLRSPKPAARPADPAPVLRPVGTRMVAAPAGAPEQETMTYSQFGAAARNPETRETIQQRQRAGKIRLVPG